MKYCKCRDSNKFNESVINKDIHNIIVKYHHIMFDNRDTC